VFEIVEEGTMPHDFGSGNSPLMDAPRVFDKSPRPNSDEGKQRGNAHPSSDGNSGLYVQEESSEEAHSEVGMDEEFHVPAEHSKALDLKALFEEQNIAAEQNMDPICPEMQAEYSQILEGCSGQRIDSALDGLMPLPGVERSVGFMAERRQMAFVYLFLIREY